MSDKASRLRRPSKPPQRRNIIEAFVDQDNVPAAPVTMFNIRMDAALHRRLKVKAFQQDRTMKDIVEQSLREYLDSREA